MNRIEIEIQKQVDHETREIWTFIMFDLNAVLVHWRIEAKPKGKRKWGVLKYWDKYGRKGYAMSDEPYLPENIRSDALSEAYKRVRVCTWDEFKAIE